MHSVQAGYRRVVNRAASVHARRGGFALVDLLITVGIIGVLSALLLTVVSRTRAASRSAQCTANLHSIYVGFMESAGDSDGRYPQPLDTGRSWESTLEAYLRQPMTFACPSDLEIFPAVGSSYDWRDTRNPATTLAGRRVVDVTRTDTVLAFETLPGWHSKHVMNVVRVDGSTVTLSDDACAHDLLQPVNRYSGN